MKCMETLYILWIEHSEWTRMAFESVIFKNPNEKEVVDRLLRNPIDFACFLRCFYGDVIGLKFGNLFTEHLSLAIDLVKATMKNNTDRAEKINKKLYQNADAISKLLASINPYWNYEDWKDMFYEHLDLAKMMATQTINGNYKESINTYEKFQEGVMTMANMMAKGILNWFFYKINC